MKREFNAEAPPVPGPSLLDHLVGFADRVRSLDDDEERAFLIFCGAHMTESRAQLMQDLFVLRQTGSKRGGFFVEFGATNGVEKSNSYMLETDYGWSGILAEPGRAWHVDLASNRSCAIDHRCVTDRTGDEVAFVETDERELSTIERYADNDHHGPLRRNGTRYAVATVSLNDLLREHHAPRDFDYLSVDTEGSELAILSALDFDAFRPKVITVEHNFSAARQPLYSLLTSKGYQRTLAQVSQFDDWYVLPS